MPTRVRVLMAVFAISTQMLNCSTTHASPSDSGAGKAHRMSEPTQLTVRNAPLRKEQLFVDITKWQDRYEVILAWPPSATGRISICNARGIVSDGSSQRAIATYTTGNLEDLNLWLTQFDSQGRRLTQFPISISR